MMEDTINRFIHLKEHLETLREYDRNSAEDIVDEVISNMITEYENDYFDRVPEEDSETIDIYSCYYRTKDNNDEEEFLMLINGDIFTSNPDETCARSFDILVSVANEEGIRVRRMTSEELLENGGLDAIGGYKFSINRKDFERVIEHADVLKRNKTIPKTLARLK